MMNFAQIIDPERDYRAADRNRPGAPAPTVRIHLQDFPQDRRRGNGKLVHAHRARAGDGTSRRVLEVLAGTRKPMSSLDLARQMQLSKQKVSMAVSHLYGRDFVSREGDFRPYLYSITDAGRKACA